MRVLLRRRARSRQRRPTVHRVGDCGAFVRDPGLGRLVFDHGPPQCAGAADLRRLRARRPVDAGTRSFGSFGRTRAAIVLRRPRLHRRSPPPRESCSPRCTRSLQALLRAGGDLPLELRVTDETASLVFARVAAAVADERRCRCCSIRRASSRGSRPRHAATWAIEVSRRACSSRAPAGYWPTGRPCC